ncbi:MAG: YfhO family protein [Bacteroidetes bacterium]|nr:YfhO family protein [Bacteroidota bacterium]MCB9042743.1 YfhO family protein [Chitinophagales bacterium]
MLFNSSKFNPKKIALEIGLLLLLIASISGIGYIVFAKFFSGEYVYMFTGVGSDTINTYYPRKMQSANYAQTEGDIMTWSFYEGMGQNRYSGEPKIPSFISLINRYIGYYFFPAEAEYRIVYNEFLKILLTGIFFYFFLRLYPFRIHLAFFGAIMFAFSGYMTLGTSWYAHSGIIMDNVFLWMSFELFFRKRIWWLLPLAFYNVGMGPYLYFAGSFLLLYGNFRYFTTQAKFDFKKYATLVVGVVASLVLAVGLSAPGIVSSVSRIVDSPRLSGAIDTKKDILGDFPFWGLESAEHYYTAAIRFMGNDYLGNGTLFSGWRNYLEAPIFYVGLLFLLLIPQVFFLSKNKKLKLWIGGILILWALIICFPYLRYAYYLFTGDYYKHGISLFVSFSLVLFGLTSFSIIEQVKKVHLGALLASLAVALFIIFFPFVPEKLVVNTQWQWIGTAFLSSYTLLLLLWNSKPNKIILGVIMLLSMVEITYFGYRTVNDRDALKASVLTERVGYNDYTLEALAYLNQNDNTFYRINKEYSSGLSMHPSINDAMIQGFYGTTVYTSFNQKYYIRFLQKTDIIASDNETDTRWAPGLSTRPFLHPIGSVKYEITKGDTSYFEINNFAEEIACFPDNIKILRNKYYLPLGFTYDKRLTLSEYEKIDNNAIRDIAMAQAFICEDEDVNDFLEFSTINPANISSEYTLDDWDKDLHNSRRDTMQISMHKHSRIEGFIYTPKPKLLFFSIPYDEGWNVFVDGNESKKYLTNIGFMGVKISGGKHAVVLQYIPPFSEEGKTIFYFSTFLYVLGIGFSIFGARKNSE